MISFSDLFKCAHLLFKAWIKNKTQSCLCIVQVMLSKVQSNAMVNTHTVLIMAFQNGILLESEGIYSHSKDEREKVTEGRVV